MNKGGEDEDEDGASQTRDKASLQRKVAVNLKLGYKQLFAPRIKLSIPAAAASLIGASVVLPAILLFSALSFLPADDVMGGASPLQQDVAIFENILADLDAAYVDKVPTEKLFETGVQAMLSSLDPYTEFENKKGKADLEIQTFGRYGGVGLSISEDWKVSPKGVQEKDKSSVRVMNALQGYAFESGIRPGDHIFAIDGASIQGKTVSEVADRLHGEPGTDVQVTFKRDGEAAPREAVLHRRLIRIRDVPLAMAVGAPDKGIGYIKLGGFAVDAGPEVKSAIAALQKNAGRKLSALVLDLRGNPGGLLSSAVEVAENFLPPETTVVTTRGRSGDMTLQYKTKRKPILSPETKVVVMTDGGTASAAEIVTASLQDHDRAIVIGQKTFGKGLVQQVAELPFETSLKFTVAKYYTPSGRCIQSVDYNKEDIASKEAAEREREGVGGGSRFRIVESGFGGGRKVDERERKTFVTSGGRKVRDGGGIEPDLQLVKEQSSELELQLASQNAFENFAAAFAAKHPDQVSEKLIWRDTKVVTSEVYDAFVAFTLDQLQSGFELRTRFDSALADLGEAFKSSGYESLQAEAQQLEAKARAALQADFHTRQQAIGQRLEDAIRARVEPEALRLAHALQYDKELEAAVKAATDEAGYEKLLAKGTIVGQPPDVDKVLAASVSSSAARSKGGPDSLFPPSPSAQ